MSWRWFLFLPLVLLSGCTNYLARRMVAPPNEGWAYFARSVMRSKPADRELRLVVGPPEGMLAVWVLEPKAPCKGTILMLHGVLSDHRQLQGAAEALREAGYRAVMVDLRGHGESTPDLLTYGVVDARDLAQLTTWLQKNNLCGEKVGVFGTSYGAATAILFAGADARVAAVVAVAPFATLREEATYYARHMMPLPGWFMSAGEISALVDAMGREAGFDPDASAPVRAIGKTGARVKLIHGTWDCIVPSEASRQMAAAAPERVELTLVPGKGHLSLCLDVTGQLREGTRAWFDRYLGGGQ